MKAIKVRFKDGTMAVFEVSEDFSSSLDDVLEGGRLLATKMHDVWHRSGRSNEQDAALQCFPTKLESLPLYLHSVNQPMKKRKVKIVK